VSEISAACREQSVGIEQINQAIVQLDQVTQSNAGAANEMAATADDLSSEAADLTERAAFFQLGNETEDAPETAKPVAAPAVAERSRIAAPAVPVAAPAAARPAAATPNSVRDLQERAQGFRPAPAPVGFALDLSDDGFERMSR